ncbi:MAG: hypothetical protein ABIV26_03245, partial [Candidatus Limnocylindrales bacterium]
PDTAAVERAFINDAHDPLHELAADPRLSRSDADLLLRAMKQVENDFDGTVGASVIAADLADLASSADAALAAIGVVAPPCN